LVLKPIIDALTCEADNKM